MSDRLFAGIWLLLCLAGLYIGWGIQSEYSYEPVGPRPFPIGILLLMSICAIFMLIRKSDTVSWPHYMLLKRLLTLIVALFVYAWWFERLGFPLDTALLAFCIGMLFGATWWAAAISGCVMGVFLFYAFDRLLDVTLPIGSVFS
ncbi:tripartite tricarboxylate transporter TctB family protein [Pectobacteriaceae bacterium CE70]|uniref:Tripartite tricarboxylate transporter TctB family protein n=1 Tax=Serratia sp. (strain ATCC 39006) TaxID=104623 RepID=A0A2I5TQF5_SERS3|nr:tripartite tricarboxylate transporter TctB family protein [Serratia sp. ATCC 39006]WJV61295.1 tripartite tricarboxylate transporter TctB family protein [Pectobacteriaceae bacterium C52]WJV65624.1 tripartite tricarboxylate transporter TctB family protein [Pectobacteriaceae bacterium CE70]WJY09645.1 tripartite tricarboxylate transporter TctB family protein [Pectobacteriaceae bacterium C80]AUH02480.1 tripartite tricarboxylate transporter TctB family protein [Serratia sp. ATCC 39006]AUH06798.1 